MSFKKLFVSSALILMLTGCGSSTDSENYSLELTFFPSNFSSNNSLLEWSVSAAVIFDYYGFDYSPQELNDYHHYNFEGGHASLSDLDWLFWDLGGIDSYVTGSLTFREIEQQIDRNHPILLEYRSDHFFDESRFFIVYGYDYLGRIYLHEPGYGLRIVSYDDLFVRRSFGIDYYWSSSLVLFL